MYPEQVLSFSRNWNPCSEPAELWVCLWVFATCRLWTPFAAAPKRKSPVRMVDGAELGYHASPREPELNRHADPAVRNRSPRCGSSPFDARVPEWSPGGSYGHPRHISCSFVLWPVHLVPGQRSAY